VCVLRMFGLDGYMKYDKLDNVCAQAWIRTPRPLSSHLQRSDRGGFSAKKVSNHQQQLFRLHVRAPAIMRVFIAIYFNVAPYHTQGPWSWLLSRRKQLWRNRNGCAAGPQS
jgi:hypothetical protein